MFQKINMAPYDWSKAKWKEIPPPKVFVSRGTKFYAMQFGKNEWIPHRYELSSILQLVSPTKENSYSIHMN